MFQVQLYKPYPECKKWYGRYTDPFTKKRESAPLHELKSVAKSLAKKIEARYYTDQHEPREQREVTIGELYNAVIKGYQIQAQENPSIANWSKHQQSRWRIRMGEKFAHIKAMELTGAYVDDYKLWAQGIEVDRHWEPLAAPVTTSTVNRDLTLLTTCYNNAIERGELTRQPFKMQFFSEKLFAREGFIEQPEYDRLTAAASTLWMRTMLAVAYFFGLREQEMLGLRVSQYDRANGKLNLKRLDTKNKEPRFAPLEGFPEVSQLLDLSCEGKQPGDYILTRGTNSKRNPNGKIYRTEGDWAKLLKASGVMSVATERDGSRQELLLHDMRRSALRNMVQKYGIDRDTARRISGHKRDDVFSRYNIVSERSIFEAGRKIAAGVARERERLAEQAQQHLTTTERVQ